MNILSDPRAVKVNELSSTAMAATPNEQSTGTGGDSSPLPTCQWCGRAMWVVRYGTRNGHQVYRCRMCHRTFTDNGAMPYMRTPVVMVNAAAELRACGLTFRQIRERLGERFGHRPSLASLHKWALIGTERRDDDGQPQG